MKTIMLFLVCGILAASVAPAADLQGSANSVSIFATGTLAPLGSFEMQTAPVYTRVAVVAHLTALALERKQISVQEAKTVYRAAHHAKALADKSLQACAEDKLGKCTGDEAKAMSILGQAYLALGSHQ